MFHKISKKKKIDLHSIITIYFFEACNRRKKREKKYLLHIKMYITFRNLKMDTSVDEKYYFPSGNDEFTKYSIPYNVRYTRKLFPKSFG